MTTTTFMEFLSTLHASMSVEGRNTLLFVDNCPIHPHNTPLQRNTEVNFNNGQIWLNIDGINQLLHILKT
jgi:hypothetical protein